MILPGVVASRRRDAVPFSAVELLVNAETQGATANDFIDASSFARTVNRQSANTVRSNGAGIPVFGSWGISYASSLRSDWLVGSTANWPFLHDATQKWTIDMQVDPTAFSGTMTLFDTGGGTTTNSGIYCGVNSSRQVTLQIYRNVDSTFYLNGTFGTPLDNNTNVRHLRLSFDPALGSNNVTLYENGSSRGSLSKTGLSASVANPAFALRFGGFGSSGTDPFRGSMDEVRVVKGYALSGVNQSAAWPTS